VGLVRGCDALSEAIAEGRRLIEGLRPSVLDHLGLVAALREMAADKAAVDGWTLSLDLQPLVTVPDKTIELTIYRIFQEALNNIRKHAQASQVTLQLESRADGLTLMIEDDGRGFDFQTGLEQSQSLGLTTMHERARLIQAELEITTAPQQGTCLVLEVPLSQRGSLPDE
jgi:signal transduction histidine kinase